MAISARNAILFNAAAVVITVAAVAGVVRSWFNTVSAIPCDQRYRSVMTLAVQENGAPLTAADLQSRFGGRDVGLLENVEIAKAQDGPAPLALKVKLPKGSGAPEAGDTAVGGMSFPWEPRAVRAQNAVCLSYGVMLSSDFDMSQNGILPGLIGRSDAQEDRFAVHVAWFNTKEHGIAHQIVTKPEATPGMNVSTPQAPPAPHFEFDVKTFEIPRGRWARISQELVLNKPDASDGILRIWVDGRLALERTDMRLRTDASVVVTGVSAATHILNQGLNGPAPGDSTVWYTPYELRW